MSLSTGQPRANFSFTFFSLVTSVFMAISFPLCFGQGAVDYTGTGGRHTIQGTIYFPSGRRSDAPGLRVKLESLTTGDLSVFTDSNGSFTFKNLTGGSYTIVIDGTDEYEPIREPVYIDDPGNTSLRGRAVVGSTPRIFKVPIYLMPKQRTSARPGVLNAALAGTPKAAADLYLQARESAQARDHKKAVDQLTSALSIYPQFPLALNELGVQYLWLGQAEKAAETLAMAVRLAPDEFLPRLNYGIALLNQGKFAGAEEQLTNALSRNSGAPTAHMYLGVALMRQHKLDQAETELRTAIGSNSSEVASAHQYLAGIFWGKRDYKRAADELETYLRLVPNAADAARAREAIKVLRSK